MALRQAVKNSFASSILKPQVTPNATSLTKLATPTLGPVCSVTQRFFTTKTLSQSMAATFLASRAVSRSDHLTLHARGFAKQPAVVQKKNELEVARTELLTEVQSRIEDIKNNFEDVDDAFLADSGFKLEKSEDGTVVLRREVEGFIVEVTFRPGEATIPGEDELGNPEGDVNEDGELEAQNENENAIEGEEIDPEAEGEAEDDLSDYGGTFLTFDISVQSKAKTGEPKTLSAECEIDVYGLVQVVGFTFDRKDNVEITENIAAGLKGYFEKLGVDEEKFVPFVWDYCRTFHDQTELNRLKSLQQFLEKK